MDPTLANRALPEKISKPCAACGRGVVRCRTPAGAGVVLEYCTPGSKAGTYTITAGLFDGIEPTATPAQGRGFRVHACPKAEPSHSAASFERKRPVSAPMGAPKRLKGNG